MPRTCTICTHLERAAIEQALAAGDAFRMIAKRFGTSPAALFRHKAHLSRTPPSPRPSAHGTNGAPKPQALTMAREPPLFPDITHPKKRAFLMAFVLCGRRVHAAKQAKIDVRSHCWWMQKDQAYAEAFGQAEQMAADMAEDEAYRRGIEGVEEGVWYKGERVGTETKYSDTVLLAILNAGKPQKYKYRVDTTHDISPAMARLQQAWQELRDAPPPPRPALTDSPTYDVDAEPEPSPSHQRPPSMDGQDWSMLDAANQVLDDENEQDDDSA